MNTPDPALQSVLRQMSKETGLSISVIHPGSLRDDAAREAFSGLHDGHVERLVLGEPSLSMESDETIRDIDREIACAVLASIARSTSCGAWAAFFEPDGTVDLVLPGSVDDGLLEESVA
ncbi:MAG: hypothetical protein EOO66_22920 [Methylobacterium sp.]|nr:MAG: hypothetical protein EOO66_22920 [Methylobacterium sp.]